MLPIVRYSADDQVQRLKTVAAERGWTVMAVFTDRPTSARGPDRRPGEAALIDAISNGTIDRVLIWSVCRIGKSLVDLVSFMETCRTAGVAVFMLEQGIDTETSNGMSMLDLTAMMALHLRQSRRDRILRGQAAARSLSIRFGRPPIPTAKIEKAKHISGDGQRSSRGGEAGRWDQPSSVCGWASLRSTAAADAEGCRQFLEPPWQAGQFGVQSDGPPRFCGTERKQDR